LKKTKIIRTATIPFSLNLLLKGQLSFLNQHVDITAVSGAGKDLDEVARREGVKTYPIEMQRQISPLKDLKSLWKLYRYFKKERPQIVHSITPKAGLLSMLAAKMAGVPVRIHTFTGLLFPYRTGLLQKILITTDKILCWAATSIFPEGKGVMHDLQKFGITQKPLKIIANGNVNGIDLHFFSPEQVTAEEKAKLKFTWDIDAEDFVFVFVGRLVKDKGINELVSAFSALNTQPQYQHIKLLLVGNTEPALDPLEPETIAKIEHNSNIIAVGFQPDVRSFLAISTALVFPSYREGFPNVVLQAGAMGLPMIVTDISGCNEIVIPNENGIIIEPRSEVALREAMKTLLDNSQLRIKLQESSRSFITSRYNQDIVWNSLLEEYRLLLSKHQN